MSLYESDISLFINLDCVRVCLVVEKLFYARGVCFIFSCFLFILIPSSINFIRGLGLWGGFSPKVLKLRAQFYKHMFTFIENSIYFGHWIVSLVSKKKVASQHKWRIFFLLLLITNDFDWWKSIGTNKCGLDWFWAACVQFSQLERCLIAFSFIYINWIKFAMEHAFQIANTMQPESHNSKTIYPNRNQRKWQRIQIRRSNAIWLHLSFSL